MNQVIKASDNNRLYQSDWIAQASEEIHEELSSIFAQPPSDISNRLWEAARYSVLPAGKCIRPLLVLGICADLAKDHHKALLPACALELLHVSSLVHDDLPEMDDDDMRRGRPSCHVEFGQSTALLTGDLLIALAHMLISQTTLASKVQGSMHSILSLAMMNICLGQQRDLEPKNSIDEIQKAHILKTGALFSASAQFGVLLSKLETTELLSWADDFGISFGAFFQVADDFLDLHSSREVTGREPGSDQRNKRDSLFLEEEVGESLLLSAFDHLNKQVQRFSELSPTTALHLQSIVDLVVHRPGIEELIQAKR